MRAKSLSPVAGYEAKEQNNKEAESRFYGEIDEDLMEEAGKTLIQLFQRRGSKAAKRFYQWLHEETKDFLKKSKNYRSCVLVLEKTEYEHRREPELDPAESFLEKIAECFESGKYKESRLMADEFIETCPDSITDLNHRLYEPFMAVVRKSIKEAIKIAEIFKGYKYENWADDYARENGKLNKAQRRD